MTPGNAVSRSETCAVAKVAALAVGSLNGQLELSVIAVPLAVAMGNHATGTVDAIVDPSISVVMRIPKSSPARILLAVTGVADEIVTDAEL